MQMLYRLKHLISNSQEILLTIKGTCTTRWGQARLIVEWECNHRHTVQESGTVLPPLRKENNLQEIFSQNLKSKYSIERIKAIYVTHRMLSSHIWVWHVMWSVLPTNIIEFGILSHIVVHKNAMESVLDFCHVRTQLNSIKLGLNVISNDCILTTEAFNIFTLFSLLPYTKWKASITPPPKKKR